MSSASGKIALIGFMGSGKSTVSRLLGGLLGYRVVEVDDAIVRNLWAFRSPKSSASTASRDFESSSVPRSPTFAVKGASSSRVAAVR